MKKYICLLLFAQLPMLTSAYYRIGSFKYNLDFVNNTAEVTEESENSSFGSITIPSTIEYNGTQFNVTAIDDYAFEDCPNLTSVTIPSSVTSIGWYAFSGCTNLKTVTLTNNVTYIGGGAFNNTLFYNNKGNGVIYLGKCLYKYKGTMPNNTRITITNGTTCISGSAFSGCSGLKSISIPNSVTSIGDFAFKGCTSLPAITIPDGITTIEMDTFYGCSSLTSVTIPNSVTSIGGSAFMGCSGLTSVTIPNSVTSIDAWAFKDCTSLNDVIASNSITYVGSSAFENTPFYDNLEGVIYFGSCVIGCKGLYPSNVVINDGVVGIGAEAFYGCPSLYSVIIPEGVKIIGHSAFKDCFNLTSVSIPSSATDIRSNAFEGCGLEEIIIPDGVKEIPWYCFQDCNNLKLVTIPSSITSIGDYAFYGCNSLNTFIVERNTTAWQLPSLSTFPRPNYANLYVPKGRRQSYVTAYCWSNFKTINEFPSNDVNEDGQTNVVDVVDIARTVVGTLTSELVRHLADQDNSNSVTIADAIILVNEIAGDTNWAKPMMALSRAVDNDVLKLVSTDGNNLSLQMNGNGQYAAFQFDLWLPEDVDVMDVQLNDSRRQGHQLLYNKLGEGHYRMAAISTAANSFYGTTGELLDMTLNGFATDKIHIDEIRFVTQDGRERQFDALDVSRDGITTFVDGMNSNDNCDLRTVYNLNGQRLNTPRKGLNIINGKKVVIK